MLTLHDSTFKPSHGGEVVKDKTDAAKEPDSSFLSWSADGIHMPLSNVVTKFNARIAMEANRDIRCWMRDIRCSEEERKPLLLKIVDMATAVDMEKKNPSLRTEIYMQIMKQLHRNPVRDSELNGWRLLSQMCKYVDPHPQLLPYLKAFLIHNMLKEKEFQAEPLILDAISRCFRHLGLFPPSADESFIHEDFISPVHEAYIADQSARGESDGHAAQQLSGSGDRVASGIVTTSFVDDDGNLYEGQVKEGTNIPHGFGKTTFRDDSPQIYHEGGYFEGKRRGDCTVLFRKQLFKHADTNYIARTKFIGKITNEGLPEGKLLFLNKHGDTYGFYEGSFMLMDRERAFVPHGEGELVQGLNTNSSSTYSDFGHIVFID